MVFERDLRGYNSSLGLCVTFELTPTDRSMVNVKGPPYRRAVTISLPERKPGRWFNITKQALIMAESGDGWPIRMDWERVKEYLSLNDLIRLEKEFQGTSITFTLYNAPSHCFNFDWDDVYRAVRRKEYAQTIGK